MQERTKQVSNSTEKQRIKCNVLQIYDLINVSDVSLLAAVFKIAKKQLMLPTCLCSWKMSVESWSWSTTLYYCRLQLKQRRYDKIIYEAHHRAAPKMVVFARWTRKFPGIGRLIFYVLNVIRYTDHCLLEITIQLLPDMKTLELSEREHNVNKLDA